MTFSTFLSLKGTGATAPTAKRHFRHFLLSITRRAAALTMAISCATRPTFKKAIPVFSALSGILIWVNTSTGSMQFSPGPVKNSSMGTSLAPPGPSKFKEASITMRGGAQSADGAALQRLPPTVATFRIWGFAMTETACASAG